MIIYDNDKCYEFSGTLPDLSYELCFCYENILIKLPEKDKYRFASAFLEKINEITRERLIKKLNNKGDVKNA